MKKVIEEQYQLSVLQVFKHGPFDAFRTRRSICIIVPVSQFEEDELTEMHEMSIHLLREKERNIAMFRQTKDGHLRFEYENGYYTIFQIPFYNPDQRETITGRSLAMFHQRGRTFSYPVTRANRIGKWKELWEKRLDQLEMFWRGKTYTKPLDSFDQHFIESFPYFVGLCENAIQYLVDTELDGDPYPIDSATICHNRFHQNLYDESRCKLPTEWVYDHASRDIAEYIRHGFFSEDRSIDGVFLEEYDRTTPLSPFFWRLLYSRLLFPVHYFECIENYYLSQSEDQKLAYEEKLQSILRKTDDYEQLLLTYSSGLFMRSRKVKIPTIQWLTKF